MKYERTRNERPKKCTYEKKKEILKEERTRNERQKKCIYERKKF
jgi:hypothetical protein